MESLNPQNPQVIFESDSFYALYKPPHWVINESKTAHGNNTVQSWIERNVNSPLSHDTIRRSGIVHRIDKETSGILLVAKTAKAFEALQKLFFDREVSKEYTALVHGTINGGGDIDVPIGRLPWNKTHFGVLPEGRPAQTAYDAIGKYSLEREHFTLLSLKPKTGRTHQLRVHLKHIGKPIVADPLYAGKKFLREDRVWCERLFLHASTISFVSPDTGELVNIKSQLPPDLVSALSKLSKDN